MKVPRDLLIFSPFTVRKPCANSLVGVRKPACCSIAGQNSAWKYKMSLPMKWYSSASEPCFQLQRFAACPSAQEFLAARVGKFEKVMIGVAPFRLRAGHGGIRVDQLDG